jgi:hypothetical protein
MLKEREKPGTARAAAVSRNAEHAKENSGEAFHVVSCNALNIQIAATAAMYKAQEWKCDGPGKKAKFAGAAAPRTHSNQADGVIFPGAAPGTAATSTAAFRAKHDTSPCY